MKIALKTQVTAVVIDPEGGLTQIAWLAAPRQALGIRRSGAARCSLQLQPANRDPATGLDATDDARVGNPARDRLGVGFR